MDYLTPFIVTVVVVVAATIYSRLKVGSEFWSIIRQPHHKTVDAGNLNSTTRLDDTQSVSKESALGGSENLRAASSALLAQTAIERLVSHSVSTFSQEAQERFLKKSLQDSLSSARLSSNPSRYAHLIDSQLRKWTTGDALKAEPHLLLWLAATALHTAADNDVPAPAAKHPTVRTTFSADYEERAWKIWPKLRSPTLIPAGNLPRKNQIN